MTPFFVIGAIGLVVLVTAIIADEAVSQVFSALESDLFSGTVIGAFVTTFGFSSGIATAQNLSMLPAIGVGIATGVVFGAAAWWATRFLMRSSEEGAVRTADLVGSMASVVTDIPADGFGQINVVVDGHITRLSARAAATASAPAVNELQMYGPAERVGLVSGSRVRISKVLSPTAVEVEAPPDPS